MRKGIFLVAVLMLGVFAMVSGPAFAGYDTSDTMRDQLSHTTFGAATGNYSGDVENPLYGPGDLPSVYNDPGPWGFPGCDTNGGPNTIIDAPVGYRCDLNDDGDNGIDDASLIIQDLFAAMTEGTVQKGIDARGIGQFLDSLFAWANGGVTSSFGNPTYVHETLDQDLADLGGLVSVGTTYNGNATLGGQEFLVGIWQRLHEAFVHAEYAGNTTQVGTLPDFDGLDQTMVSYMADVTADEDPTLSGVAPGIVVSYIGTWFQMGGNLTCNEADDQWDVSLCSHNEFGGDHGDITTTLSVPDIAGHDP
jgi:hypothetical protein